MVPEYGSQRRILSVFLYTCPLVHDRTLLPPGSTELGPVTVCTPLSTATGLGSHSHHCTEVCCPVTFSTELFSQTDRYFKFLVDSYFSKLGNGESSNAKGGIQLIRYLREYLAVHSVLGRTWSLPLKAAALT